MFRAFVRAATRTVRKVSRAVRRQNMYRLRVEASLPLPTGDEIVSGETMIAVPGTRRTGTFRALIQRVSEAIIGGSDAGSDAESDDDSDHEINPNQLAIESGTAVDEQVNLSRRDRMWNVISGIAHASMSAIAHAPTIFGLFGGILGLYNSYRRMNGDDEFVIIRKSELKK